MTASGSAGGSNSRTRARRRRPTSSTGSNRELDASSILSLDVNVASQQFVRHKLARLAASNARRQRLARAIESRNRGSKPNATDSSSWADQLAKKVSAERLSRLERRANAIKDESREFNYEKRLEGYVIGASNVVAGALGTNNAEEDRRAQAREIVEDLCAHVAGTTNPLCRRYDEELCEGCGARKFLIPHEAALVCPKCTRTSRLVHPTAAGVVHTLDDDVDANPSSSSHSGTNRNPHLLRQLAFYIMAQRKGVPVDICERIYRWIVDHCPDVRTRVDGKREHVSAAIRALRLKKYESYCSTIYSMIFGHPPLMLTPAERVRFYCAFRAAHENGAPRTYRMCIGLLFELMGLDECAEDFLQATMIDRSATTTSKRHSATTAFIAQCEQWEAACLRIGWPVSERVARPLRHHRERQAKADAADATRAFFEKMDTDVANSDALVPDFSFPPPAPVPVPVPAPAPVLAHTPMTVPEPAFAPKSGDELPMVRTTASRSLRYKTAIECDPTDFLKRGMVHYVPVPATWAQVRYYILTRGGHRDPPLDRKTKRCTTHCVAWRHNDWVAAGGGNAKSMKSHWLSDADELRSDDRLVVARLPCSVGYELREPADTKLAALVSESDRLRFVIDQAAAPAVRDCADPRNHDCNAPSTAAERKRAQVRVLKVPHGIPAERLRPVADGELPLYFKDGQYMVLR